MRWTSNRHVVHALEFVTALEGRIDEREAAPLRRRREGNKAGVTVDLDDLAAPIAAKSGAQALRRRRMQFAENRPILGAQDFLRDERRSRIGPALENAFAHSLEIGRKQSARRGEFSRLWFFQTGDALAPLARSRRRLARQVIKPRAGVRIDETQRRVLALQIDKRARQHRMFQHVGEIAGVIFVTIIHDDLGSSGSPESRSDLSGICIRG